MFLTFLTATIASTTAIEMFSSGSIAAVSVYTGTTKIKVKVK